MHNLVNPLSHQGQHADAELLYRPALQERQRVLGPWHAKTRRQELVYTRPRSLPPPPLLPVARMHEYVHKKM